MAIAAPPREPAVTGSESHDPIELLIEEARTRARRRRLAYGAVAAMALAAIASVVVLDDTGSSGRPASPAADAPAVTTPPVGDFDQARGRIVYAVEHRLEAVDPEDQSSRLTLEVPADLNRWRSDGGTVVPAGWSADGTRLALTDEHRGARYVMEEDGAVTRVPSNMGCCGFVTSGWLSPDGTTAVEHLGRQRVVLRDVDDVSATHVINREPAVDHRGWFGAWSPDGSQIAYTGLRRVGTAATPATPVYVFDLERGTTRQLAGSEFGHIRQMAWSPDGSQLVVVAGEWVRADALNNPLASAREASLYLVDVDGSDPREIASGHYVAATWSPDGSQLAAIDYASGRRQVVLMNADGSDPRVLVELPPHELFTGLAWHPLAGPVLKPSEFERMATTLPCEGRAHPTHNRMSVRRAAQGGLVSGVRERSVVRCAPGAGRARRRRRWRSRPCRVDCR